MRVFGFGRAVRLVVAGVVAIASLMVLLDFKGISKVPPSKLEAAVKETPKELPSLENGGIVFFLHVPKSKYCKEKYHTGLDDKPTNLIFLQPAARRSEN